MRVLLCFADELRPVAALLEMAGLCAFDEAIEPIAERHQHLINEQDLCTVLCAGLCPRISCREIPKRYSQ
jgi:hypothetical protein